MIMKIIITKIIMMKIIVLIILLIIIIIIIITLYLCRPQLLDQTRYRLSQCDRQDFFTEGKVEKCLFVL